MKKHIVIFAMILSCIMLNGCSDEVGESKEVAEVEDRSESNEVAEAEESIVEESKVEESIVEESKVEESGIEENENNEILTIDNCEELVKVLNDQSNDSPTYEDFADKYRGRTIEFDGYIDDAWLSEGYNTRCDVIVRYGNWTNEEDFDMVGPTFKLKRVGLHDSKVGVLLTGGTNIKIRARIDNYDKNQALFYLNYESIESR